MKLIDKKSVFEAVKWSPDELDVEAVQRFIEILSNQPTVDAVPVIRCKDCKYWNGSGKFCDYEMSALENDFCSWAERKVDADSKRKNRSL